MCRVGCTTLRSHADTMYADQAIRGVATRRVERCHSQYAQQAGSSQVEWRTWHQHGLQGPQVHYICPQRADIS